MQIDTDYEEADPGEVTKEGGEVIPDTGDIRTVYAIKDGMFNTVDISDLSKKNYFYRVHSKVPGIAVIDYDKTNVVPIVKDILNRQNTFIEIKYLRWGIVLNVVLLIAIITLCFVVPLGRTKFDTEKAEIIAEIRKASAISVSQSASVVRTTQPTDPLTNSTKSDGYNPVLPPNTNENTHKNIPNYAN